MKEQKGIQWQLWLAATGLLLLTAALWPAAASLADLTGEEAWRGQVVGVVHWLNTAVRPQPDLAVDEFASADRPNPLGVNVFLQQEVEPEKRAQSLEMAGQAGFKFIRQEFQWEDIEIHGKGDFVDRRNDPDGVDAWAKYDNIVDLAEQYDIEIIARLSNPPSWSRSQPDEEIGALAPPDDLADFADFAAAVAARYGDRINHYQIWNEPNGNDEWGFQDVNPEAYTELLCMAYERIKEVDPEAVILAGALTPTLAMDGRNMNDLIYLQRMYNAGRWRLLRHYVCPRLWLMVWGNRPAVETNGDQLSSSPAATRFDGTQWGRAKADLDQRDGLECGPGGDGSAIRPCDGGAAGTLHG